MKLKDFTIRQKLFYAVGGQIVFVVLLVFFIFFMTSILSNVSEENVENNKKITKLENVLHSAENYLIGKMEYENLRRMFFEVRKMTTDISIVEYLGHLEAKTDSVQKFRLDNEDIEKEIMGLADFSIKQSDSYIEQVVGRLMNPKERNKVSQLERKVVVGANINTSSNYNIKVFFQMLKQDLKEKSVLLDYLDRAVANAIIDERNLANTHL